MPASLASLRRHCCFTTLQLADKHLERAKHLLSTRKREDVEGALVSLESALVLCPAWEKALELKARALLYLKRFKDVVEMLHEYVPSLLASPSLLSSQQATSIPPESPVFKEKTRLLSDYVPDRDEVLLLPPLKHCFSIAKLRKKLSARLSTKKVERQQQWRYLVLGQACCQLGMLEDAVILLQSGKRTASAVSRRQSNGMREDNFCAEGTIYSNSICSSMSSAESELVTQMLSNIKFLLRRRTAAMAALEAGLYAESVRHFSKIIDGRKGTPQGFIADCYLHRAIAYQATGRVVDAIADCNRNLALNPHCTKALSVRASLHEMVRCFSECLLDLQQLKMMYEASLRYQMLPKPRAWTMRQQHASDTDFAGGLSYINSKITATRQRLSGGCTLDAHTILDMPRNCTMEDVKRAYLLISLKHRPDKATHFIERCDFVDHDRDLETVKEEARASALRLSQLIHKAFTKLLSSIAEEEETEKQNELLVSPMLNENQRRSSGNGVQRAQLRQLEENASSQRRKLAGNETSSINNYRVEVERVYDGTDWGSGGCWQRGESAIIFASELCGGGGGDGIMGAPNTESVVLEAFTGFDFYGVRPEEEKDGCDFCQPFGGFSTSALANALSQALCNDLPPSTNVASTWTPDWSLALALALSQPLPVT